MKFHVGDYVRYHNRVWVIEDVDDKMMFIRDVETNYLDFLLWFEYDSVVIY